MPLRQLHKDVDFRDKNLSFYILALYQILLSIYNLEITY